MVQSPCNHIFPKIQTPFSCLSNLLKIHKITTNNINYRGLPCNFYWLFHSHRRRPTNNRPTKQPCILYSHPQISKPNYRVVYFIFALQISKKKNEIEKSKIFPIMLSDHCGELSLTKSISHHAFSSPRWTFSTKNISHHAFSMICHTFFPSCFQITVVYLFY